MAYDLPTTVDVSEGIGGLGTYLSTVTFSWFWNLILIAIYIIFAVGVSKSRNDIPEGLAVAGFVTAIMGTLLWIANWISGVTFAFTLAVAIMGAIILWVNKPR